MTTTTACPDCARYSKTQADHSGYADRHLKATTPRVRKSLIYLRVKYLYWQDVDSWSRFSHTVRRVREKQFCGNLLNSTQIDRLLILLNVRLHLSAGINLLISLTKRSA